MRALCSNPANARRLSRRGGRVSFSAVVLRSVAAAAALCACALTLAQPPKPKPPALDGSPRFEIRRFIFDGVTLVPLEHLEALTQPFTGPRRQFGDVQRALEVVERAYSEAGWSAVQVVLPE